MAALLETAPTVSHIALGPEADPSPVAVLDAVSKHYAAGVVALRELSLTLHRGEIVALLGPNGAGKSTAVKLMMGLAAPTAGSVRIFGKDPRFAANRLRTGVMLQVGRAPETLKVKEHLELFRGYYPHPLPVAELVRLAGLKGLEDRLFGQLSGGGKQRVLFALALAGDPDLVFLDEPTAGLDIEARRGLWQAIRELAARGKTVLLTTHYLEEADALASRIVVIAKGHVICQGTPTEIKAQGASRMFPGNQPSCLTTDRNPGNAAPHKHITCITSLPAERLRNLVGVLDLNASTGRTTLTSNAAEDTLRELLALDATLSDLHISSPALEDAFLALTAQENSTNSTIRTKN